MKKTKLATSLPAEPTPPPLSSFQQFKVERIPRSSLKFADYNPRTIDEKAKRRLKTVIQKNGLVEPIVWNKRTGNIVGGHQRINQIDLLHGDENYTLDVAVVDMSLTKEMETNIALNNAEAQGVFDINLLSKMFKDPLHSLDVEATGFDLADMMQMFGENPLELKEENLSEMAEKLAELRDKHTDVKEGLVYTQDPNYFIVLIFKDHLIRQRFTSALSMEDNRYVDGKSIADLLDIDLTIPTDNESGFNTNLEEEEEEEAEEEELVDLEEEDEESFEEQLKEIDKNAKRKK